jgi:hypothetical protein
MKRKKQKLTIDRDTIRALATADLTHIAGGDSGAACKDVVGSVDTPAAMAPKR